MNINIESDWLDYCDFYIMNFVHMLREERRRAYEAGASTTHLETKLKVANIGKINDDILQLGRLKVWATRSKIDIEEFRKGPIVGVYYIPNWITPDEEFAILERVYGIPNEHNKWVKLKHRRLQMWGGEVKAPFDRLPLPEWLEQVSQTLVDTEIFTKAKKPNHALINEYGVGDCILPHEDGPLYHPLVSIISTGAKSRITFTPHRALMLADGQCRAKVTSPIVERYEFQLERCSLLIFTGEAYTHYLHSIDNIEEGTRVSLTIRHVNEQ
ncbi:putative oxoglutarate/iron-dependent dioxygenase, alpha-ketoglutarate-dependent dioxygenase AlkB [Plasmopara halstedii]